MIRKFLFISFSALALTSFAEVKNKKWCEDFLSEDKEGKLPSGWEINATKWGVNKTSFELKNKKEKKPSAIGVLKISSDEATGALFCEPYKKVNLKKTPVLRWRWLVNTFPKGGDGRKMNKDDQAIVIYIGASDWMIKKTIAYRWETETPKGDEGEASYAGGAVKVKWFCLRNRKSGSGKWVIEERNIAKDFKKAFGFIPEEFVLSIGANSQNTKSESLAFVDYIEFLPLDKAKTL
jgi:Protein of unknown function (DUF3047)